MRYGFNVVQFDVEFCAKFQNIFFFWTREDDFAHL